MDGLTASQSAYADKARHSLGLGDWTVTYRLAEAHNENIADVDMKPRYCEAVITIYSKSLAERQASGFPETVESLILHELCEIAVGECCECLPDWMCESEPMMEARDRMADKMRRTCERLGLVADAGGILRLGDYQIHPPIVRPTPDFATLHDIDLGVTA